MITHKHHIIPRHAGGTDDPSNLIELTIPEHAEAHRVLWEQHGRIQDKLAWLLLSGKKEEAELARIELMRTPEYREKMSQAMTGLVRSEEHRANLSKALRGKSPSEETRAKMAEAKKGNSCHLGHKVNDAGRQRMREAWARRKASGNTPKIDPKTGRFIKKS